MTNPANSAVQNLLPVQAYFDAQNNFVTFIGQGQPFYAAVDPYQSGLHITNSTIDSSVIGGTTPAAGTFTSFATTTGTIATQPTAATDIVNLLALQSYAAGISWKQPCAVATLTSITLSGLQTIDTYTTLAGDRVLVKNQGTAADNGIYIASAGAWTRALDADAWQEFVSAISFIEYGSQAGSAWFCTATPGGTLGVTPLNWSQFTTSATYLAGTGLTLNGFTFSITNTGVPASTYGSATATPVFAVNAQGQITSVTNTTITPAIGNVTGLGTGVATFLATPTSANLASMVSDETGSGALVFATSPTLVTPALGTPASGIMTNVTGLPLTTGVTGILPIGNGGTGQTTASAAFNALSPITTTGDLIYGSGVNTSSRLAIGTSGQILSVVAGIPAWVNAPATGVTSFSAGTTGLTPSTGTTGAVTLAGTLNIANGGTGITAFGTGVQTALGQNVTGSGGIALATSPSFTTPALGVATGTSVQVTGGFYSTSSSGFTYTDGIVVDYITGTGRFSVGTGDGFAWYNAGVANTSIMTLSSAGALAAASFSGAGTGLTGTASSLSIGGNAATATSATSATNATNATNTGITDDTTNASTVYPTWVTTTTGNLPQKTSSTKLSFVPNTGTLTATAFVGDGSGLTGVGGFPSGTRMMFAQTSAPTGWTKDTVNYNNHAIRVVTGTASTGGTVDFTTAFASQTPAGTVSTSISAVSGSVGISGGSVGSYTLTTTDIPSHQHLTGGVWELNPFGTNIARYGYQNNWVNVRTNVQQAGGYDTYSQSVGGGGSHSHSFSAPTGSFTFSSGTASSSFSGSAINLAVKYLDVITATKN